MGSNKITRSLVASLLLCGTTTLYAVAPGNIDTGLDLWLKADNASLSAGTFQVTDASLSSNNANQVDISKQPIITMNGVNFNKTILFDGTDDVLIGANAFSSDDVTSFTVYSSDSATGRWRSPFINRDDNAGTTGYGYYTANGAIRQLWQGADDDHFDAGILVFNEPEILTISINSAVPKQQELFVNSTSIGTGTLNIVKYDTTNSPGYYLGSAEDEAGSGPKYFWKGAISEHIVYDSVLSPRDKRKVESYLALKYGMTLDTTNENYLTGSGSTIWTHVNNLYDYHIIGIAKDDSTSLNQEISKSINTGAILTVSSDNNFTGANGTHTDLADGDYLLIGNNNGATTTQTRDLDTELYTKRVTRVWRMEKKVGSLTTVNLKFDGFDDTWDLIRTTGFSNSFASGPTTIGTLNANGEALNVPIIDAMRFTLAKKNLLSRIGTDADDNGSTTTNPTAAQLNDITGVTGALTGNEDEYQVYINTHPNEFSSPATPAEVQTMIDRVNTNQTLLENIGIDADGGIDIMPTSVELNNLPNVIGAIAVNEDAYQEYINVNPDAFSSPATEAEVQTMIDRVNANKILLENIGIDADGGDDINVTAEELNTLIGVTGAVVTNEDKYQLYINTYPNEFSIPATVIEVQVMVDKVNNQVTFLEDIGIDANGGLDIRPTADQLNALEGVTGAILTNEEAYQRYINIYPNKFSSPATEEEVQEMITTVNVNSLLLENIGIDADGGTDIYPTAVELNKLPTVTGAILTNEVAYQEYINRHPYGFNRPATEEEVQIMIDIVNHDQSFLKRVGIDADGGTDVLATAMNFNVLDGVSGAITSNEVAYQEYINTHPNKFSDPATREEIQAMIFIINGEETLLGAIAIDADGGEDINVTARALNELEGVVGAIPSNEIAYQIYINTYPERFSSPATAEEVQTMVTTVNANQELLVNIGEDADGGEDINVTAEQLNTLVGVSGAITTNEIAYQVYINTYPNEFSAPATEIEVQKMIDEVNKNAELLVKIGEDADGGDEVHPTAEALNALEGVVGAIATNEVRYQEYIDTYPNRFSLPATVVEVQTMVTDVNSKTDEVVSFLGTIGEDADGGDEVHPTAIQLNALEGVSGAISTNEEAYQEYINTHPNEFSSPATESEIQAMIVVVNNKMLEVTTLLSTIGEDADGGEDVTPTAEELNALEGVSGAITNNEELYQEYINTHPNEFSSPATEFEIQAMIIAVNSSKVVRNGENYITEVEVVRTQTRAIFTGISFIESEVTNGNRRLTSEVLTLNSDDIQDVTTSCENVSYNVYVLVNTDGTMGSGYTRSTSAERCTLRLDDNTVSPAFKKGTQLNVRETSTEEKLKYGNSGIVIVSDTPLDDDIILGGI